MYLIVLYYVALYLSYLSSINYTCDDGHYFPDNSTFHSSICDAAETWTLTGDQLCSRELIIQS